jgi:hypothetical protein
MTLAELIQVLEAAKKGSTGLDRLICETMSTVALDRRDDCFWAFDHVGAGSEVMELDAPSTVHPYSTSIDAALELVPEGWSWHVRVLYRGDPATPPMIRAVVFHNATGMILSSEYCEAEAETAPIGLCIAALRARASLQKPMIAPARRDAS